MQNPSNFVLNRRLQSGSLSVVMPYVHCKLGHRLDPKLMFVATLDSVEKHTGTCFSFEADQGLNNGPAYLM